MCRPACKSSSCSIRSSIDTVIVTIDGFCKIEFIKNRCAITNWAYREKVLYMPKKEEKKQFEKKKATINWAYREKNMHMPKKRRNKAVRKEKSDHKLGI